MKYTFEWIRSICRRDGKDLTQRALKTAEETGELAEAVLSYTMAPGSEYKGLTKRDVLLEAADVTICGIAAALEAEPDLNVEGFLTLIGDQLAKWEGKVRRG